MKFVTLNLSSEGIDYELNPIGRLFCKKEVKKVSNTCKLNLSGKATKGLNLCNKPFELNPHNKRQIFSKSMHERQARCTLFFLNFFCRFSFLLARLYASIPNPIFESSLEASFFYRKNSPIKRNSVCLGHSLLPKPLEYSSYPELFSSVSFCRHVRCMLG